MQILLENKNLGILLSISEIPNNILTKVRSHKNEVKLFHLVQTWLEESVNSIEGPNVHYLFRESPLGKCLHSKFSVIFTEGKDKTLECGFIKGVNDVDQFIFDLEGIAEMDTIYKMILDYKASSNTILIKDKLTSFLKKYPYYKDYTSTFQCTLLYAAAASSCLEAAKVLVEDYQCEIDLPCDEDKSTPLLKAAKEKNKDVFQFLFQKGANDNKENNSGESAKKFAKMFDLYLQAEQSQPKNKEEEENSQYKWQNFRKFDKFVDFTKSESEKIHLEICRGSDDLIKLADDMMYSYKLDAKKFDGHYNSGDITESIYIRYLGKPPAGMFCMKSKTADKLKTAIKWQIIHEKLGLMDCSEEQNKEINNYFLEYHQLSVEISFDFSEQLTANKIDASDVKSYGKTETSQCWQIVLDLQNFAWNAKDYDLSGHIRWIPSAVKDPFIEYEDVKEAEQETPGTESDKEEELDDSNPREIKMLIEKIEKGPALEPEVSKKEEGMTVFEGKAKFYEDVVEYFQNEKIGKDQADLVVYGSAELAEKVDRIINLLMGSDRYRIVPSKDLKEKETQAFPNKADLVDKLDGIIIGGSPIKAYADGKRLLVYGTLDQLADTREVIDLFSKPECESEDKILRKCFFEASYLIEELREALNGNGAEIMQDGRNIIVSGNVSQLGLVAEMMEQLKDAFFKQRTEQKEQVVENKGFLAEHLNNFEVHGEKIIAKTRGEDLVLTCSDLSFSWVKKILPVLEEKCKEQQNLLDIKRRVQEINQHFEATFKLNAFLFDLNYEVFAYLNNLVNSIKEEPEVAGGKIIKRSTLKVKSKSPTLEILVEMASENQLEMIKNEISKIEECFQAVREADKFYKEQKRKSIQWVKQYQIRDFRGSRKALWQSFKALLEVELDKLLEKCSLDRNMALKTELVNELHKDKILYDEFIMRIFGQFYDENDPLNEVKKLIQTTSDAFIKKMKEDTLAEIKSKGQNISSESLKVLDQLIKETLSNICTITEKAEDLLFIFYRVELLIKAFKLNLPIFKNLPDFVDKLKNNRLLLVKASTGSGKSTLLPPLLLASGYQKVAVTQPRRLPCRMISRRVNDTFDNSVSGWAVSGQSKNPENNVLYLTDGLLKELIMAKGDDPLPYDVIILDEIHERGQNVDLCIALLSLKIGKPQEKFNLILCSATVDKKILDKFAGVEQGVFDITISNANIKDSDAEVTHPVILSADLAKYLKSDQQLLCFLPSTSDVKEAVKVFKEKFKRTAYPLLSNQPNLTQEDYLQDGQVFFSTTIAETSLTFKNLVFVVDSCCIRAPLYDHVDKVDVLVEQEAAKSTARQRRGRLGRTKCPGTYFASIKMDDLKEEYPISELEKINLVDVYFNLLRATKSDKKVSEIFKTIPLTDRKNDFKEKVKFAKEEMIKLNIIDSSGTITWEGKNILDLPVRGAAKMVKAVYSGLTKFKCGQDMIILASFLIVLGQAYSVLLNNISKFASKDGDFASLINVMYALLKKRQLSPQNFSVPAACKELGLHSSVEGLLENCYKKYTQYEEQFAQSQYKVEALYHSSWENIAKALLEGYYDQIFVNKKYLGGSDDYYVRLHSEKEIKARLSRESTLSTRPGADKENFILAKEINFVQYGEHRAHAGTISLVGRLEQSWMTSKVKRKYVLGNEEKIDENNWRKPIRNIINLMSHLELDGEAGDILECENDIDNKLRIQTTTINLEAKIEDLVKNAADGVLKKRYQDNFDEIKKDKGKIFKTMFWQLKNNHQVEINFHSKDGKIEIKRARQTHIKEIQKKIDQFISWFKHCNAIRTDLSKVYPQTLDSKNVNYTNIRNRIERITNPNKDQFELMEYAIGPKATRTTRMELVAWILINEFDCTVEGGFIRDWVVGGRSNFPAGATLQKNPKTNKMEIMDDSVSPKDLDVQLSSDKVFNFDKLRKLLSPYRISMEHDNSDGWRHFLTFDKDAKTGAFTADLIEPFAHACQDMIDMDVSNLYVMSGFTNEIGMRIPLDRVELRDNGKIMSISLEAIIQNIKQKKFQVLRSRVNERIEKMKKRGWTEIPIEYKSVLPMDRPGSFGEVVTNSDDKIFKYATDLMSPLTTNLRRVVCLANTAFDNIYDGIRELIKHSNNGQSNEKVLFHGTSEAGADGIIDGSFDNRFYKDGAWGYGAYFADNPKKSDSYTQVTSKGEKIMFICKVILGKEQVMNQTKNGMVAPDHTYDSVRGTAFQSTEYIVYRFGQAKPFLMVVYK